MSEIPLPSAADATESLVRAVRRIGQAIDVRSREIARLTGLTLPQLLVLQSIRHLGEVSTRAISRDVSMSPPTVVAVLDRLEARGLIVRYRSTTDRRIVHARLTEPGHKALAESPDLLHADVMARLALLPANKRRQIAGAVAALADLMSPPDMVSAPDPLSF